MKLSRDKHIFGDARWLWIALLAWLFLLPARAETGPGDKAPSWTMRDGADSTLHFPQDIDADMSVVLFWASWCPYCEALMPRISVLQQEIGINRLPVLALRLEVPEDSGPASVPKGFRVFENAWDVAEDYGVSVLPALFLVRDGRIVYRLDYPPPDHPSQQLEHGRAQAVLLGQWWEQRLRGWLRSEGLDADSG